MNSLKLSLPGFSAHSSRVQEEILDNRYASPKIDSYANPQHSGVITIKNRTSFTPPTRGNVQTIYSFPHKYGHVPSVIGNFRAVNDIGETFGGALPEIADDGVNNLFIFTIDSDLNRVNVNFLGLIEIPPPILPFTIQLRFYVMAERGCE